MNMTAKEAIVLTDMANHTDAQKLVVADAEMSFDPQDITGETDYTVAQTAKLLGKSIRQVQRLLTRGLLSGYKVNGPSGLEWRVRPELGAVNAQDSLESRFQHLSNSIAELSLEIAQLRTDIEKSVLRERELEAAILLLVKDDNQIKTDVELLKEAVTTVAVIAKDQQNNWFNRLFAKV